MPFLLTNIDADTGVVTEAGLVEAINYRRGKYAVIEIGLYADTDAMADGLKPTSITTVTITGDQLTALEEDLGPDVEDAVFEFPAFSGATPIPPE